MKKVDKDSKKLMFEMLAKIDPTFKPRLNENIIKSKSKINEYGYNPENDPDTSLDDIEVTYNMKYPQSFEIMVKNGAGGYKTFEGFELLDMTNDPSLHQYFDRFENGGLSNELVNSKDFYNMATRLFNVAVGEDNVEWDYEQPYEPDEDLYRDR